MIFEDLKKLYLQKKKQFGANTYKHISQLLKEAKISEFTFRVK